MRLKVSVLLLCTYLAAANPFLLPENHPLKTKLDALFASEERVLANPGSVEAAGFTNAKRRKWSKAIVSKHPGMKGYLFKMYTDDQTDIDEWDHWIKRVEGAQAIRKSILAHGFQNRITVPRKWIYLLPEQMEGKKNAILVVQEVHKVDPNTNLFLWKTAMSQDDFTALLTLIEELGLFDSVYPFNIPFTKAGKLAFIDTEIHSKWPVPYEKLLPYLSQENRTLVKIKIPS